MPEYKDNLRLLKHPSSKGDQGDAYLYLEALIQEIPEANADLAEVLSVYWEHSGDSVMHRAGLALSYAPDSAKLTDDYLRQADKQRQALQEEPFKVYDLLAGLLPKEALLDPAAGLDGETFHQETAGALEWYNNKWQNGHPNGMHSLQLVCAVSVYMAMGKDVTHTLDSQVFRELILGSSARSKNKEGAEISALVSNVRKFLGSKLRYNNKNARTYLRDARLAAQVLYKHKGSLETALKERLKANPAIGPFTTENLSSKVSPFYRALGIRLQGREPLHGRDPVCLPDTIRKDHSSTIAWGKPRQKK